MQCHHPPVDTPSVAPTQLVPDWATEKGTGPLNFEPASTVGEDCIMRCLRPVVGLPVYLSFSLEASYIHVE